MVAVVIRAVVVPFLYSNGSMVVNIAALPSLCLHVERLSIL